MLRLFSFRYFKTIAVDERLIALDIIIEFDNVQIESVAQLKYELYRHNVGDVVTVKINRNGSIKDLQMTLTKGDE